MDIRILRYFLAVAREENITRAAESLHIAQPSLSKQLMELEHELGRPLLVRGKRRVTLTEDGVLLRRRAEEIINHCAHPDYRPLLREYLRIADKGHEPQSMTAAFAMHDTLRKKGDMRLTDFSEYLK